MQNVYLLEQFHTDTGFLVDCDVYYTLSAGLDAALSSAARAQALRFVVSFDTEDQLAGVALFAEGGLRASLSVYHLNRGEQQEHHPKLDSRDRASLAAGLETLLGPLGAVESRSGDRAPVPTRGQDNLRNQNAENSSLQPGALPHRGRRPHLQGKRARRF